MEAVGVFEAKNTLSALLDRVERGDEIIITRRGKPIARLVPNEPGERRDPVETLMDLRKRIAARTGRMTWGEIKALRDEGRR